MKRFTRAAAPTLLLCLFASCTDDSSGESNPGATPGANGAGGASNPDSGTGSGSGPSSPRGTGIAPQTEADGSGVLWQPLEWSVENTSWSDNPFDLVAAVTFTHSSGASHETEMFYDGDDTWKFRFTGTLTGTWMYSSSSEDPELDGRQGTVEVAPNPGGRGFVTSQGNKFAIQSGDNGELRGWLFNNFQTDNYPQFFHAHLVPFDPGAEQKMTQYASYARDRGFTSVYLMLVNNLLTWGAFGSNDVTDNDPDLKTFRILDELLESARAEGIHVHFWRWGDASRRWSPDGLPGGINGSVDQRVSRYFCARLGALPSWSIGYGFDLHEWVSRSELDAWKKFMHDHLDWPHLISARSHRFSNADQAITGYAQGDRELGQSAPESPNYDQLVSLLDADGDRPHMLEERNVLGRWGVDAGDTRRLMWRSAMAGGVGGWYGFFDKDPVFSRDSGYPNDAELLTHGRFWSDRFLLGFRRDNARSNGFVLRDEGWNHVVVYRENAASIDIDLSRASGPLRAVAVDARAGYEERDLGMLEARDQTIDLPRNSDWAVAVGSFSP